MSGRPQFGTLSNGPPRRLWQSPEDRERQVVTCARRWAGKHLFSVVGFLGLALAADLAAAESLLEPGGDRDRNPFYSRLRASCGPQADRARQTQPPPKICASIIS